MDRRTKASRDLIDGLLSGDLLDSSTPFKDVVLVARFASGNSIAKLNEQTGRSEDEVREALRDSLPCEIYEVTDALGDIQEYEERKKVERNRKLVLAWSHQNEGRHMREAAELFGLQESQVNALLGKRRKFHRDEGASDSIRGHTSNPSTLVQLRNLDDVDVDPSGDKPQRILNAVREVTNDNTEVAEESLVEWISQRASLPTEPEAAIQECHREIDAAPTRNAFDEWATRWDLASAQDLMDRTQCKWRELVRAAGITDTKVERSQNTAASAGDTVESNIDWSDTVRPEDLAPIEVCDQADIDSDDFTRASQTLHRLRQGLLVKPKTSVRDRKITARYSLGHTLDSVGRDFGLTRERIRQIVSRKAGVSTQEIQDSLRIEKAYYETRRFMAERRAVHAWSKENIGEPVASAAEAFGLPEDRIRKALGSRKKFHVRHRHPSRKTFSDEQLIQLLRTFHEETGSTVSQDFEDWSRARGGPSRQTVMIRFEKWALALELAGISGSEEVPRSRLFTERDCWACVIEFLQVPEVHYTFAEFEEWTSRDPHKPSSATIRNRLLIPWSEMVDTGLAVLSGNAGPELGYRWVADVKRKRNWSRLREERQISELDPHALVKEAFEEQGFPLTIAKYNEWATAYDRPNANKILNTTRQKWNDILDQADIPLSPRQVARGSRWARKQADSV